MKKIIVSLLIAISLFNSTGVFAKIGDVEGYTKYTDIVAYINHFTIPSYNVNGYTVVVAEDLTMYGFNVVWDANTRTLNITRNKDMNEITTYLVPYKTAPNLIGKNAQAILSTDIKTFVNGIEAKSYNIDGKTVVDFDSLSAFGKVDWVDDIRAIKLWVEDGLTMSANMTFPKELPKTTLYSADGRTIDVYEYEVNDYLNVGWYSTQEEANEQGNLSKNMAAINNFYVGQDVCQWNLLFTSYGVIRDIDYSNGKVKVYWNYVEDAKGKEMEQFSARIYGSLYSETWEDAYTLSALY